MKNVGHVEAFLDMKRLNDENNPDSIIADCVHRWGSRSPSADERARILQWMRDQVKARFLYDYKASLDMDSGRIIFQVSQDDFERGGPWIISSKRRVGLTHDDNGGDMDSVVSQCEKSYAEYANTAISYSIAGLEQHDRQS